MEILFLLLALVVVVAGASDLVVNRRRAERRTIELEPAPRPPGAPARPEGVAPPGTPVEEALAPPDPAVLEAPATPAPAPEAPPAPAPQAPPAPAPAPPAAPPRLRDRLGKTRSLLAGYVGSVLGRQKIDAEVWDELEEALIRADVGVATTGRLIDRLRSEVDTEGITEPEALLDRLKADLKDELQVGDRALRFEPGRPNVWLFVGVNGVGKTTTIGKVGRQQQDAGRGVVMAAGDTFRAAAAEQLELWAQRVDADLVRGAEGSDPGAVVFDAVQRAAARGKDLVLADTAGRLHTKVNLMEELRKVRRVADREPGRVTEVLLVLDATTGQNGLVQAKEFTDAVDVTGVALTKLDGSAKGGIVVAVQAELGIPVKLVGLGETVDDLVAFDPDEFVEALFS